MEINSLSSFKSLKVKPSNLLLLIHKYVQIELIKNTSIIGFIHSIDPIDLSLVMLVSREDKFQATLIPGHAILDLCVVEPDANVANPFKQDSKLFTESKQIIAKRRQQLVYWLKENLLPVSEKDDNIIIGNVTILPPYNVTNVCTDNPIIAMQISNVIQRMPDNY